MTMAGSGPAPAGTFVKDAEQCKALGGRIVDDGEKRDRPFCTGTSKDRECEKQLGAGWSYDHDSKKCVECFVTTACVGELGLDDDCFELTALRRFRDNWLASTETGPRDIARYYETAPGIVAAISRSPGSREELRRLYALYILPSAILATIGLPRVARSIYTRMMADVSARYPA